jgi:hypothetical protein
MDLTPTDLVLAFTALLLVAGLFSALRGIRRGLRDGWGWLCGGIAAQLSAPLVFLLVHNRLEMPSKDIATAMGTSLVLMALAACVGITGLALMFRLWNNGKDAVQ